MRESFGAAVGAGRGEDAEMSHGARSFARCAGGTHTCSDVAGTLHTLYSGHDSTVFACLHV